MPKGSAESQLKDKAKGPTLLRPLRQAICLCLIFSLGCGGSQKKDMASINGLDPDTVRYRLLLRENPVDSPGAFRCFGACQSQETPDGYVDCLSECPGFEVDSGFRCMDHEIPPVAACLTARKVTAKDEMDPALVVLTVIAGVAVVVGLSSVCAASASSQCGYSFYPPPQ